MRTLCVGDVDQSEWDEGKLVKRLKKTKSLHDYDITIKEQSHSICISYTIRPLLRPLHCALNLLIRLEELQSGSHLGLIP